MYDKDKFKNFEIGDKVAFQWSIIRKYTLIGILVAKLTDNNCIIKVTDCHLNDNNMINADDPDDILFYIKKYFGDNFNIELLNDIIQGDISSLHFDGFLTRIDNLSLIEKRELILEDGDYNS